MSDKQTIFKALQWASSFLKEHGRDQNAGEILLMNQLKYTRSRLLAEFRTELSEKDWEQFSRNVKEHAAGRPVQYIMGHEVFLGREFVVNPHVLIPRPETEELVIAVLKKMDRLFGASKQGLRVADVGTGSGAIAVTLKLERPGLAVYGTDISASAIDIAKKNADRLGAAVRFAQGDLLQPLMEIGHKFHVIVSNPPYIPQGEKECLPDVVKDYEPACALFGGEDGLDVYRRFTEQLPHVLEDRAIVAFEVGAGQGDAVSQMMREQFSEGVTEVLYDINGKDRIVLTSL
ncbi:peptide chain release factor N(5)-glutamine methyltransferase [Siminovitchia sp. FSL H7-0308]|uniref:peptide chain release factor N(5)-glutamine methyltransferase n=1 Tax=Siminovitchia sp. FSL H7-0308 TaxID=2921432 RepID=UPI0030EC7CF0